MKTTINPRFHHVYLIGFAFNVSYLMLAFAIPLDAVAHHLSIFSKADDQALKAFVTKRFGVRRLHTFPLRKIALGSFRGGA